VCCVHVCVRVRVCVCFSNNHNKTTLEWHHSSLEQCVKPQWTPWIRRNCGQLVQHNSPFHKPFVFPTLSPLPPLISCSLISFPFLLPLPASHNNKNTSNHLLRVYRLYSNIILKILFPGKYYYTTEPRTTDQRMMAIETSFKLKSAWMYSSHISSFCNGCQTWKG
jgi:hypothetical protein